MPLRGKARLPTGPAYQIYISLRGKQCVPLPACPIFPSGKTSRHYRSASLISSSHICRPIGEGHKGRGTGRGQHCIGIRAMAEEQGIENMQGPLAMGPGRGGGTGAGCSQRGGRGRKNIHRAHPLPLSAVPRVGRNFSILISKPKRDPYEPLSFYPLIRGHFYSRPRSPFRHRV